MAATFIATPAQASLIERLRRIPGVTQLVLLIGLAGAIAGGLSLTFWANRPGNQPLYAGLPAGETAAMADALSAAGIEHALDPNTGALTVPAEKLQEARLKLAAAGLPKSAGMGFESLQGDQGFGVSQSVESARMQHALETELVRTISALQPVKSARVHLAIPKASAFTRAGGSASASVLVELHPGRNLNSQQVASIVHMVSSSVPDMPVAAVSVIDQTGRLLTDDSPDSPLSMGNSQFEQTRRTEDMLRHRLEDMLTPLVGNGRVRTQVIANLDFTVQEETQEAYKGDPSAVRSEEIHEDSSRSASGSGGKAQGVPGATSNRPPEPGSSAPAVAPVAGSAAAPAATPASTSTAAADLPTSQTKTSTRNYELGKTTTYRKPTLGQVQKLSVAVLVDYLPKADTKGVMVATALSKEELARIEALTKEAVGFDAQRGDSVTVQNAPFVMPETEAIASVPLWQRPELQNLVRQSLVAVVLLVLILTVVRPLLRNLFGSNTGRALAEHHLQALGAPPGAANGQGNNAAGLANAAIDDAPMLTGPQRPSAYEQKLNLARDAVKADPKRVAQVMKTWIAQE
jgi:flagellar M-ring protein FliF